MLVEIDRRQVDERLLIARLVFADRDERTKAMAELKPSHWTLRYLDWFEAIRELQTAEAPIPADNLLSAVKGRGVVDPQKEWHLCCAEIPDTHEGYEDIRAITARVIRASERQWLADCVQRALNHGLCGELAEFDEQLRTARGIVYRLQLAEVLAATDGPTPSPAQAKRDARRRKFMEDTPTHR